MEPHVKLWLEKDGQLTMSDFRAQLLRHIRQSGSLAFAASAMGLSYRRAWGKLREIEQHLGYPLVQSAAGGSGGGSSRLTADGERLLDQYTRFQADCREAIAAAYARSFLPGDGGEASERAGEVVEPIRHS